MKPKAIWLTVFAVVLIALVGLGAALRLSMPNDEPTMSEELDGVDPTDMSLYYAMGEYYPPDAVDTLNISWQGGRVEIVAYDGSGYFVEEASTRYLLENERLAYTLDDNVFSVRFTDSADTVIDDAYKKLEIRIPRKTAQALKSLNISTNGEVVLKNLNAESITVNGGSGSVRSVNTYSNNTGITTTAGNVELLVDNSVGYSVSFTSKSGTFDSYVDNGMDSYVSGDGSHAFKVKTKSGSLDVELYLPDAEDDAVSDA